MAENEKNEIITRYLEIEDKEGWLELFQGYILFYNSQLSNEQYELTWNRLLEPSFQTKGIIAIKHNQIIGIAHFTFHASTWAKGDYCYLEDLFVDPLFRGNGVGKILINKVKEIAIDHGSQRLYWNTKESNHQARYLYDQFTPVSEMVQYRIPL